jgi:hypothetical protein
MQPFLKYLQENLPPESQWILFTGLNFHSELNIYRALLQLEEDILRPLHKKNGAADPTYIFMMSIKDMLYQAAESIAVIEHLKLKYQYEYEQSEFFKDRSAKLQQLLTRFELLEDIPDTEYLQMVMTRLRKSARENRTHFEKQVKEEKNK